MATLTLPGNDLLSVVTLSDRGASPPSWETMFAWPRAGDADIPYDGETMADRNRWATRLDQAVLAADRAVLLVASGTSCFATAWWARLSPASYVSKVAGALLFTPYDTDPDARPRMLEKFASPHIALPFPSAILDAHAIPDDRVRTLAESWGSRFVDSAEGQRGSARGTCWHQAEALIMRLSARVVERDMRIAATVGVTVDAQ